MSISNQTFNISCNLMKKRLINNLLINRNFRAYTSLENPLQNPEKTLAKANSIFQFIINLR